jgi:hypothetical protein
MHTICSLGIGGRYRRYQYTTSFGTSKAGLFVDETSHGGEVMRLQTHHTLARFDGR